MEGTLFTTTNIIAVYAVGHILTFVTLMWSSLNHYEDWPNAMFEGFSGSVIWPLTCFYFGLGFLVKVLHETVHPPAPVRSGFHRDII